MDTTKSLLDQLKARFSLRSDYAVSKFLSVTQPTVYRWRDGGTLSDEIAIRVADLLKISRAYVLACMAAERASGDLESSGVWRQIADVFKDKVAVVALLATLGIAGFPANDAHAAGASSLHENVYYVKRPRVGRRKRDGRREHWPTLRPIAA